MKSHREVAAILRLVADLVEKLSSNDLADLLNGRATLHLSRSPERSSAHPKKGIEHDVAALISGLKESKTREQATALLEGDGIPKTLLERIARLLDLPVLRSDSADRIRNRIVESVVGYRIDSEAIKGRPKGSS